MRHSPLTLWHLLSLDAPTVAALWTWFVARSCGVTLPPAGPAAMFTSIWILYAADRLLDARSADATNLEERHHFHDRHRRFFVAMIAVAAIVMAALTPNLLPQALRLYALLGALLAAWFLLIHTRLAHERRLPKELAVGFFFAAAIFIPTVAMRPDLRLLLLTPAILFGAVCALNCMMLYAWEHPNTEHRPNANWTTRLAILHLDALVRTLFATAILIVAVFAHIHSGAFGTAALWPLPAACALSIALLAVLHSRRTQLSPLNLRAAADLALLTPVLFAAFIR